MAAMAADETPSYRVREGSPLHIALTEAMYDHGRWDRPGAPPPALEWTVASSSGEPVAGGVDVCWKCGTPYDGGQDGCDACDA